MKKVYLFLFALSALPCFAHEKFDPFMMDNNEIVIATDYIEHSVERYELFNKINDLVSSSSKGKAVLINYFKAPYGIIGAVIKGTSKTGKETIGWIPPGGNVVFFGEIYNKNGENLNEIAIKRHKKKNALFNKEEIGELKTKEKYKISEDRKKEILNFKGNIEKEKNNNPLSSKEIFKLTQNMSGYNLFKEEGLNKEFYLIYSPNCIYCKRMVEYILTYKSKLIKKKIQVKMIPVNLFGNNDCLTKASFDLQENMYEYKNLNIKNKPKKESIEKINKNTKILFEDMNMKSSPVSVFNINNKYEHYVGAIQKNYFETDLLERL